MKPLRQILTAGIAAALLNCTAPALTLPVSEDTSTSTVPALAKVAGRDASLTVSDSRQGLIRFEAGAFAESLADAGKARLIIYLNKVTAPGALTVHRITEEWSEGGASAPAFDAAPIATIPAASVVAKQYVIIDVTATVQAWLNEPGKDFGFAIAGSDGAQVLIGAKEGPGSGYPAELQIEGGTLVLADDEEEAGSGHTRASATAPIGAFVTNADIKSNTIKGKKLLNGSVTGSKIANGTITNANLSAGFVFPSATVDDGSVTTAKIATGAVTAAKLNLSAPTDKLGIGTATPLAQIEVSANDTTAIVATAYGTIADANFVGRRARGTAAAPTAALNGDTLGFFGGRGYATTAFGPISNAAMSILATQDFTDAARGASIAFATTPNGGQLRITRMTIDQSGNVGIGTTTPTERLQIGDFNSGDGFLAINSGGGNQFTTGIKFRHSSAIGGFDIRDSEITGFNGLNFVRLPFGNPVTAMFIDRFTGNIGLGNVTPTKGRLQISGFVDSPIGPYGFLNSTDFGINNVGSTISADLYCDNDIACRSIVAFSDERIKRIQGRSDSTHDLAALEGIQVTDYTYIDTHTRGTAPQKKVIAQQVEKVFPQAVHRTTDIVPDIYQKAEVKDGWVMLATDLKKGERVRLIDGKKEAIHEVLEATPGAFRTDFAADGAAVFVYGREVKDFRVVDYEAIAMLNVSATQELHRQIAALEKKVAALEAKDKARDARLSRLESALDQGAVRTVRANFAR